jgi:hypothetical protein
MHIFNLEEQCGIFLKMIKITKVDNLRRDSSNQKIRVNVKSGQRLMR